MGPSVRRKQVSRYRRAVYLTRKRCRMQRLRHRYEMCDCATHDAGLAAGLPQLEVIIARSALDCEVWQLVYYYPLDSRVERGLIIK